MQGSKPAAIGLLVVVAVAIAVIVTRASNKPTVAAPKPSAAASVSAAASTPAPSASASAKAPDADAEIALSPEGGEGFDILPDGKKAPPLPDSAPQLVSFGVVQFAYSGAQFAPANARTKEQAKQKALLVIEEAKRDFSAAVAKGDPGSAADKGRVPRGILEPAAEYVLFMLPKGEVSPEPIDTPRGYWVIRRNN